MCVVTVWSMLELKDGAGGRGDGKRGGTLIVKSRWRVIGIQ